METNFDMETNLDMETTLHFDMETRHDHLLNKKTFPDNY